LADAVVVMPARMTDSLIPFSSSYIAAAAITALNRNLQITFICRRWGRRRGSAL